MLFGNGEELPIAVLDALPNPVLVKDSETRYVWVNWAFERLFTVTRADLQGKLDVEVFQDRQAAQCNGGDLRVLASGDVDEAEETVFDPELGARETITRKSRLTVGGQHYLVGVMHDVTDVVEKNRQLTDAGQVLEEQATELQRLASTDPLTACLNRRAAFDRAASLMDASGGIGVIAIDLDHFKVVNDTYGHEGGDAVLVHFVETARREIRSSDLLVRLGGEEFAVLLPGADEVEVRAIADRICAGSATAPATYGSDSISFTVSVGAVHHDGPGPTSLEELLRVADTRLYQAKAQGRNQVVTA